MIVSLANVDLVSEIFELLFCRDDISAYAQNKSEFWLPDPHELFERRNQYTKALTHRNYLIFVKCLFLNPNFLEKRRLLFFF